MEGIGAIHQYQASNKSVQWSWCPDKVLQTVGQFIDKQQYSSLPLHLPAGVIYSEGSVQCSYRLQFHLHFHFI